MYIERRRQDNVWFAGEFSPMSMLGHSNSIRTLELSQHYLISGSSDKLVKVWDRNNIQHCLSTLSGTNSGNSISIECCG
jgi:WD40 repeat protein